MKKEKGKNKKGFLKKSVAGVIACALALTMAVGIMQPAVETYAKETVADVNTTTKYTESLGDWESTEYAGRVWTDKSVWAEDHVTFQGYNNKTFEITKNEGEDFLVAFSVLATSQEIQGQTTAPIDVVFVVDLSNSMYNNTMDNGYRRVYNATVALNNAVKKLLDLNEYVRVGVVGYNSTSRMILPLDHYEQIGTKEFFRCSGNTITINARGTKNTFDGSTIKTQSGTNIQKGIYAGMNMLASLDKDDTKVVIDGKEISRVPSVVVLTDGEPSCASNYNDWWNIANDTLSMSANSPKAIYGMKAIMTASYMKQAINRNYGVSGVSGVKVYSIGMGITGVNNMYRPLAYATINPNDSTLRNNTNSNVEDMRDTWEDYANNQTATLDGYTFEHPASNDIVPENKDISALYYVDAYYDADDAGTLVDVFDDVVSNISISSAQVPTEHDPLAPMSSGYITYTDPIGEYMEVKNMKTVIYGGERFDYDPENTVKNGNKTTYVFTQTTHGNDVYGTESLEHILIDVVSEEKGNGIAQQVLTIKIPASLIPIRVNRVSLNASGQVLTHTHNGTYPIRVLYTVGLQDVVKANVGTVDNPVYIADTAKLDASYISRNSNDDGTIDFYSNLYSGNISPYDGTITIGDATAVFDAAVTNPFYYVQENLYIYEDEECKVPAKGELISNQDYYHKETHYERTSVITEAVAHKGYELTENTELRKDASGQWYRPAGTVHVKRMLHFEGTKNTADNKTKTAKDFYTPTYNEQTGHFTVYLGNNGVLSMEATGAVAITKDVVIPTGMNQAAREFEFTVNLCDSQQHALVGRYQYAVTNEGSATVVGTGWVTNGGTIKLRDGQTATITGLPPRSTYTIVEKDVAGFTTVVTPAAVADASNSKRATGTITAGETAQVLYTNTYSVETVTLSGIKGTKTLSGRAWETTDEFVFEITSLDGSPLPEGDSVTVTADGRYFVRLNNRTADENVPVGFDFGVFTFTKPGTYNYSIVELAPAMTSANRVPGITYTRESYRLVVTVSDNGDGTMSASPVMTKVMNANGTAASEPIADNTADFTNTYTVNSTMYGPVAVKHYTDNAGTRPFATQTFRFVMKPVGDNAAHAPMPNVTTGEGENRVYSTTNALDYVSFGQMKFEHEHVGNVYWYEISELVPETPIVGMMYDSTLYRVKVEISENPISATEVEVKVSPTYYKYDVDANEWKPLEKGKVAEFSNVYTPAEAKATLSGNKTLNGRDMLEGEKYEFVVKSKDAATLEAIKAGTIKFGTSKTVYDEAVADTILLGKLIDKTTDTNETENVYQSPITFEEITFTKPGTYKFEIAELKGDKSGVTYDEHTCTVTIVVSDVNGVLNAVPSYSDGETGVKFVNNYKATPSTAISLTGTKELTGRPLEANGFWFTVESEVGARIAYVPNGAGDTADANGIYAGEIKFLTDQVYTEAGEYVYTIRESIPVQGPKGGVEYDTSYYKVTVSVTEDYETAELTAAVTSIVKYDANGSNKPVKEIVFRNSYTANAVYDKNDFNKVLTGRAWGDDEFEFIRTIVSATDATGIELLKANGTAVADPYGTGEVKDAKDIVTVTQAGTFKFGSIKFTKTGTYVIEVKEIVGTTSNGITYDTHAVRAEFVVSDNLDGTLAVQVKHLNGDSTFTNKYDASKTLVGTESLKVKKVLAGRAWENTDNFSFKLETIDSTTKAAIEQKQILFPGTTEETPDHEIVKNMSVTVGALDADKVVNFGDIIFKKAGTYKFIIREEAGNIPGMDYDSVAKEITVVAQDNGNGTLSIDVTGIEYANGMVTFTNRYNPDDVILPGHENLHVTKNFTGRENNEWLSTDEFSFELTAGDADTSTAIANRYVVFPGTTDSTIVDSMSVTVNSGNKGVAHFGNILFTKAGRYKFVVNEIIPDEATQISATTGKKDGITYNNVPKNVLVNVGDFDSDGALDTQITNASEEGYLVFSNSYNAQPAELVGTESLVIEKILSGRNWSQNDAFTFTLEAEDEETAEAIANKIVRLPGTTDEGAAVTTMSLTINGDNAFKEGTTDTKIGHFGNIIFTKTGTYLFRISENDVTGENISKDDHHAVVIVTVTDQGNGVLSTAASATIAGSMTFTNIYTPDPVNVEISGEKLMEGRNFLNGESYRFTIDAVTEGAPMPATTTVEGTRVEGVENKMNVKFSPINYTKAGTYEYTVIEEKGTANGVTYDNSTWEVTVVVDYDETAGMFETSVKYEKDSVENTDGKFVFTNIYRAHPTDGVTVFSAKKIVTPTEGNSFVLREGDFKFELIPSPSNKTSDPIGGKIVATNDVYGNVIFANNVAYTEPGVYKYTVDEIDDLLIPGIKYDSTIFEIIVTVSDNLESGKLTSVVEIKQFEPGETTGTVVNNILFDNQYNPEEEYLTISGTKILTGRDIVDGEFTFVLTAIEAVIGGEEFGPEKVPMPENTVACTVSDTNVDDIFKFDTIEYTHPGTFIYEVRELAKTGDEAEGVTYDDTVYTVIVTVEDLLVCTETTGCILVRSHEGACATTAEFIACELTSNCVLNNNHEGECREEEQEALQVCELNAECIYPNGHDGHCSVTVLCANVEGCTLVANHEGECVVEMTEAEGCTKIEGCTLSAGHEGECVVKELVESEKCGTEGCLLLKGHEGECTVESSKVIRRGLNFVANPAETETRGGRLHASIVYKVGTETKDAIVFSNGYEAAPVTITLEGEKTLEGRGTVLREGEFSFELVKTEGITTSVVGTATNSAINDETGKSTFTIEPAYLDALKFTNPGEFWYTLREVNDGKAGITYDSTVYNVLVKVEDNLSGDLVATVEKYKTDESGQSTPVDKIVFANSYKPNSTEVILEAKKVLTGDGSSLKAGDFIFELSTGENVVYTAVNDADGIVKFPAIKFEEVGEYEYKVTEKKGDLPYVTYDTTEYTVLVTVEDNNEGNLVPTVVIKKGTEDAELVFTNTYKKPSTPKPEEEPEDDKPEIYPAPKQPVQSTGTKTGDSANLAGLFGLLAAAVVGFFGIKTYKRKKQ